MRMSDNVRQCQNVRTSDNVRQCQTMSENPVLRVPVETKHFLRDQMTLVRARGIDRPPTDGVTAEEQLECLLDVSKVGEKWRVLPRYNTFAQAAEQALTDRMGNALVFHKSASQLSASAAESAQAGYSAARTKFDARVVSFLSALNDKQLAASAEARADTTPTLELASELFTTWGTELYQECTTSFQAGIKESQGAAVTTMLAAAVSGRQVLAGAGGGGGGAAAAPGTSNTSGAANVRRRNQKAEQARLADQVRQRARGAEQAGAAAGAQLLQANAAGAPKGNPQLAAGAAPGAAQQDRQGGKKAAGS